jgi:hypothetical protein
LAATEIQRANRQLLAEVLDQEKGRLSAVKELSPQSQKHSACQMIPVSGLQLLFCGGINGAGLLSKQVLANVAVNIDQTVSS